MKTKIKNIYYYEIYIILFHVLNFFLILNIIFDFNKKN